jgi:hypothetical protein
MTILACVSQDHNIAVRCRWVDDVLSAPNIISSVVDAHYTVLIKSILLEQDGIRIDVVLSTLSMDMFCRSFAQKFRQNAGQNMALQLGEKVLKEVRR